MENPNSKNPYLSYLKNYLKNLKVSVDHYLNLIRIYQPTGLLLLFLPALWVITMLSTNIRDFLYWSGIFFIGSVVMRSAGCIINDLADINFDKNVARTKDRPLASGVLTKPKSLILLALLLIIGFAILLLIGIQALPLGFLMMLLVVIYPFTKRFLKYPQIILGIIFNSGALFASIAIEGSIILPAALLYLGAFFWILYYDTIYAHQDKIYDKELGIHSMALTPYGQKIWLKRYYQGAVMLWIFAGVLTHLNLLYFLGTFSLFYFFYKQLEFLDLNKPETCLKAFKFNRNIGFFLFLAIAIGRLHW